MANTRLLTVEQAAERMGLRPKTLRMRVWKRTMPYVKLGRAVRFKETDIDRMIEAGTVPVLEIRA